jgi:hypothetical protein
MRAVPTCPACGKEIRWKHSFSLWNPWNYPCPHCKVALEASRIQKYMAYAMVPLGALLAAVPIFLEKRGIWQTGESLMFFAIVIPLLLIGAAATWPYTRFTARKKQT